MRARVSKSRKLTSTELKFAIANAIRMTAMIAMSTWRNEIPDRGGRKGSLLPPPGSLAGSWPGSRGGPESSPSRRIATLRDADAGFSHHPRRASTSGPSSGGPGRRRAGRRGLGLRGARARAAPPRGPGGGAAGRPAAAPRRAAARGPAAASVTGVAGQGLKRVFGRPRPYDAGLDEVHLRIERPNGTSWPSSHPAVLLSFLSG